MRVTNYADAAATAVDLYRCPPVTGPTTRAQKVRAKLGLLSERGGWRALRWLVINPITLGLSIGSAVFAIIALSCEPRPMPVWLIECPDREPWESPRITVNEGRVTARDPENRRIILPENCAATEIEQ